ncbi:MAG: 4-hydroxythreonine-4-phosphate dehydrogenase PdxA [candidate division WOR-3 bacterium]
MKEKKLFNIGITSGDPFGIGPEIILKSLNIFKDKNFNFILYGDLNFFENTAKKLKIKFPENLIIENVYKIKKIPLKHPSKEGGRYAYESIINAINDLKKGKIKALLTLPVSKKGIILNGIDFKGHTEFLAKIFGLKEDDVLMSFISDNLKVALLTTHIPIKKVHKFIKEDYLEKKIRILLEWNKKFFNKVPEIAFLSLNPHKGENGEEEKIMEKVIKKFDFIKGIYPSDSFFTKDLYKNFDFIFAIYHDQGLIPFKILSKGKGCNLTIGLPFLRVSPIHGPAYEISNKNIADIKSTLFSIRFISKLMKFF